MRPLALVQEGMALGSLNTASEGTGPSEYSKQPLRARPSCNSSFGPQLLPEEVGAILIR